MPAENPPADVKLLALCEKLLALLLTSSGGVKERIVVFVGAGCSREYGIPTTLELARDFLSGPKAGLDDDQRRSLENLDADELFELFLARFQKENSIDVQRRFFDDVIADCRRRAEQKAHTYEMLVDLWRNGFIELVITTNFDHLIEEVAGDVTVLDYRDIAAKDKPQAPDGLILVKLAGDVRRSKMLWTVTDFAENVTDDVIRWLTARTSLKPLVLIGYRANEAEVRRVLISNEREMFLVFPGPPESAPDLASAARTKRGPTYHADTTASAFLAELTEGIYARSKRDSLLFSFQALREKLRAIVNEYPDAPDDRRYVVRTDLDSILREHIESVSNDRRVLVLLGDSGYGKTFALKRLVLTGGRDVAVAYVAAHEIPTQGLTTWFGRIRGLTLNSICELATNRNRRLVIIIDGLNEMDDTGRALHVLAEAMSVLDRYERNVTFIVSSRPEFWGNLSHVLQRRQWSNLFEVGRYTEAECIEGLQRLGLELNVRALRKHPARAALAIPMVQHLIAELGVQRLESITQHALFDALYKHKVDSRPSAWRRVLFKLCRQIHQRNVVAVPDFGESLRNEEERALRSLIGDEILTENDQAKVSFRFDTFAEYTFARLYLQDALLEEIDSEWPTEIVPFLQRLIGEWCTTTAEHLSYRIFLLGAMKFLVAMRSDGEINELLSSGDFQIAQLARDAVYSRKDLAFVPAFADDAFLVSVAMHRSENYVALLRAIEGSAGRGTTFPLNIASKLFPATLLDFLQYIARQVSRSDSQSPLPLRVLLHGLLIYAMRNGRDAGRRRTGLLRIMASLSRLRDGDYVAANVEQTLLESSRYLLHSDSGSRLSDITELEIFYKHLLRRALRESAFSLSASEMSMLIRKNMVTWV
ncbi:MAG TPA: SIR2 family protein, partial [Thermoanaerobaculia bacterium]